ncbi:MAG TPA: ABC transporter permease [Microbacterium sp.]|nr:ABC transporter permease [Microbacterium sp.]
MSTQTPVVEVSATDVLPARGPRGGGRLRRIGIGAASLLLVAAVWELYKLLGPADGLVLGGTRLLPRTSDLAMPHVTDMLVRLGEPVTRAEGSPPLWLEVAGAAGVTLGIAGVGWLVGLVVGVGLALAMVRWRVVEFAILPWIVLSQTVPLIAFAPLVRSWGSRIEIGAFEWQDWMSVAVIASYLAFFPIAIGALRGLQSPDAIHAELLRSYAASWWATVVRLRFPASVPYLLPALRLAAANAVVGAIVAEVSTGLRGGIGRMIVQYAGQASGDPAKSWGPIFGAIVLGLVAAGSVALVGGVLKDYRRGEVDA